GGASCREQAGKPRQSARTGASIRLAIRGESAEVARSKQRVMLTAGARAAAARPGMGRQSEKREPRGMAARDAAHRTIREPVRAVKAGRLQSRSSSRGLGRRGRSHGGLQRGQVALAEAMVTVAL